MSISRRNILKLGLAAAAPLVLPRVALALPASRQLSFYHIHTGETLTAAYFDNGRYQPDALAALDKLMRDWRCDTVHAIDPAIYDQLFALQTKVDTPGAFHIICGYRSPATNAMLSDRSDGVAKHSLHMDGKALDLNLPGKDLAQLHAAALSLAAGGVGYYPASDFIHMDTGRVRTWG
jgi:uncharacterized protein YcbK (DUF882 family)